MAVLYRLIWPTERSERAWNRRVASIFCCLTSPEGAPAPSGGGEDEHSLQIPGHRHQTPLAANFIEPTQ